MFFVDDGYSGTNFNRPSWSELIEKIENGEVATLIVKDMSRLGRDYLKVGFYTEVLFVEKGVRFMRRAESHAPHEVRSRTAEKRGGKSRPADLYVIDK